jgi:endonuclease/exonuclease/phosphatase family metal-dependent hydrolase
VDRPRWSPELAGTLGVLLLVDVLRVALPSVGTQFGLAAQPPVPLLVTFAVGWLVVPFAAVPLARAYGSRLGLAAAAGLAVGRVGLQFADGGRPQLALAALGLLAGLSWLATVAVRGSRAGYRGLVAGLTLSAGLHGALGTVDLAWRDGAPAAVATMLPAAAFVLAAARPGPGWRGGAEPVGGRVWWVAQPALLLWVVLAGSPSVARAGVSYLAGTGGVASSAGVPGPAGTVLVKVVVAAALAAFAGAALGRPARWRVRWAGVALVTGTALGVAGSPRLLPAAIALAAAGLGGCLAAVAAGAALTPARRGYGLATGGIAATAATGLHYGAYGLGVDNRPVFLAVAAAIAGLALTTHPATRPTTRPLTQPATGPATQAATRPVPRPAARPTTRPPTRLATQPATRPATQPATRPATQPATGPPTQPATQRRATQPRTVRPRTVRPRAGAGAVAAALAGLVALAAVDGGRWGPVPPANSGGDLRLVAYNVRLGYGLDSRYDPDGLAALIAGQRPDVVLLSEVDRGWWPGGGHDLLSALADRLGMAAWFAPSADPVWGDALLTRLPVLSYRSVPLPRAGAPVGAQALAVVLRLGDREVGVVATHLQRPPGGDPEEQARAVGALAAELGRTRPVVVGGDLNSEPVDPAFRSLLGSGLTDALAAARPLPTGPANRPRHQIDHVLTTRGVRSAQVSAPRSTLSDHLPVAVTVTFRPPP